jgi:hypothetical protein
LKNNFKTFGGIGSGVKITENDHVNLEKKHDKQTSLYRMSEKCPYVTKR